MSKKWLPGIRKAKQDAKVEVPQPRETAEIQKEYTDLCTKLGHASYQVQYQQSVIDQIKQRMLELDREGYARNRLEAQKPKDEPQKQEGV